MKKLKKNYDFNLLNSIIKILKKNNYNFIQYFPSSFSILAIVKEHENILNIFKKDKHLIFFIFLYFRKFIDFFLQKNKKFFKIFFFSIFHLIKKY